MAESFDKSQLPAESFDAVLAEMRTMCDWPHLGHTSTDSLTGLADRLQAAHEREVGERDVLIHDLRMIEDTLRAGYRRMAEASGCTEDAGKASSIVLAINDLRARADAAVALLRRAQELAVNVPKPTT